MTDTPTGEKMTKHTPFYSCDQCAEDCPEESGRELSDLGEVPDGSWICQGCYDEAGLGAYGTDVEWSDLPKPVDDITRLRAENAKLREALDSVMVGGNHLASLLIAILGARFSEDYPPQTDPADILEKFGSGVVHDAWCCWRSVMLARDSFSPTGANPT